MYKIKIKKTVEETYVIEHTEAGSIPTKDEAMRIATLYAQMPEREFRAHASAVTARVANSQRVLGIKELEVQRL